MKKLGLLILLCLSFSISYSQTVLDESLNYIPADWTCDPAEGTTNAWEVDHNNTYCKLDASSVANLTSAAFDVSGLTNPLLYFSYSTNWKYSALQSNFHIQLSSDGVNFNTIQTITEEGGQRLQFSIPTNTTHLRFSAEAIYDEASFSVSDVLIIQENLMSYLSIPSADLIYDMNEDGNFDMVTNDYYDGEYETNLVYNFMNIPIEELLFEHGSSISKISNLNNDSKPELFGPDNLYGVTSSYISADGGYEEISGQFANWDQNIDGMPDLYFEPSYNANYTWALMSGRGDNEFTHIFPDIVSYDEYLETPNSSAWNELDTLVHRAGNPSAVRVPDGGLDNSIGKLCCSSIYVDYSPEEIEMDMNKDGLPDLLVPGVGAIYYNFGNGKYVSASIGGSVTAKDLNNDHIQDFIVYDENAKKISARVYQGSGSFSDVTLLENLALDERIYCFDFDRDNDIDILLPFSYSGNALGTFMAICENDGAGNFVIHENGYMGETWEFVDCRDYDNDGYYDILMLDDAESEISSLLLLKGKANFEFDPAIDLNHSCKMYTGNYVTANGFQVEDIDQDGLYEIWNIENDLNLGYRVLDLDYPTANTRPAQMDAPEVTYDPSNNHIEVSWNKGNDTETSSCDLSYALRIGSAPGKCDMVFAHANEDGMRRNFDDGNMGASQQKIYNVTSWPAGTYYVSVQAIDPQAKGSPWSVETTFEKSTLDAEFSILSFNDSVKIYSGYEFIGYQSIQTPTSEISSVDSVLIQLNRSVISSNTYYWDFGCDSEILREIDEGTFVVSYSKDGIKEINLGISDEHGNTADIQKNLIVLPNKLLLDRDVLEGYEFSDYADFDNDGDMDIAKGDGLYEQTTPGSFIKLGKIFNLALDVNAPVWLDHEKDGDLDLLIKPANVTGTFNDDLLKNQGNQNFTLYSDHNISQPSDYHFLIDHNHNGYFDYFYRLNNGSYTDDASNGIDFSYPEDSEGFRYNDIDFEIDWNRDGWIDIFSTETSKPSPYMGYIYKYQPHVIKMNGNHVMGAEQIVHLNLPNAPSVVGIEDFDNDGDYDLLCYKSDEFLHILLNDGHENFDYGIDIYIKGADISTAKALIDLDNNGYKDIILYGHVIYFYENLKTINNNTPFETGNTANPWEMLIQHTDDSIPDLINRSLINKAKITNNRPEAPTNIYAIQTDTSMVINWNDGSDTETPAVQLRYNLSVKKAGESGDGSYIISPDNGGNENAAFFPGKFYIRANRYEIPISNLPAGEYEIQLQTLDLWNELSEFSDIFTINITADPLIEMPEEVCFNTATSIVYSGTPGTSATWDFDGGTIISGSGFGPYEVRWNTSGVKTVRINVDGVESAASLSVYPEIDASFTIADHVVAGIPAEIVLQESITPDTELSWENLNGISEFSIGKNTGELTFNNGGTQNISLIINKGNCASVANNQTITVSEAFPDAEIDFVSVDAASGKNKISWDTESWPAHATKVLVLKEGSLYNVFDTLAVVNAADEAYVDDESQPKIQAERYRIALQDNYQNTGEPGDIHQTVHVAINKALGSGYNLIWNRYEGKEITSYRLMRGVDADHLNEIALLSGANQSYADLTPTAGEDYYQVQVIPAASGKKSALKSTKGPNDIYSNIVHNADAISLNFATAISILAEENEILLNETQTELHLFADILPGNTSLQAVQWEIVSGNTLATINSSGMLSHSFTTSGTVTVRATTIDGSSLWDEINVQVTCPTPTYDISVSADPTNGGTVSGGGTYDENSSVTISASAYNGYEFINWTKDGAEVSTNTSYTFTATEDAGYVAHFNELATTADVSFQVDMQNETIEAGGVTLMGSFNGWSAPITMAQNGSVYSVTISCNIGENIEYKFKNGEVWEVYISGDCTNAENGNRIYFVDGNTTLPLVCFNSCSACQGQSTSYTVNVSANPTEGGTVSGGGTYDENASVTVTASSNNGYGFVNWTNNGTEVSTSTAYTFNATENVNLVANFDELVTEAEITFQVDMQNETVAESGVFMKGNFDNWTTAIKLDNIQGSVYATSMTLSPGTQVDYKFYNGDPALPWGQYTSEEPEGDCVDEWTNRIFTVPNTDYLIPAVCFNSCDACVSQGTSYTINVSAQPSEGGTVSGAGTYDEDASVNIVASPNTGYNFINWTKAGAEVSTDASYSFTATEDADYVAHFAAQSNTASITFRVDMQNETVAGGGPTLMGSFNDWSAPIAMTQNGTIYYTIVSCTIGETVEYKFKNGEIWEDGISGGCTVGDYGNRSHDVESDATLPIVCFNSCSECDGPIETYTVYASANPTEGGSVSGAGTYNENDQISLVATPNSGFSFRDWTENGTVVSTNATYSFQISRDISLLANFILESATEEFTSDNISLYPNPSTGKVMIEGLTDDKTLVKIFATDGALLKIVQSENTGKFELDLSSYATGIYTVLIQSKDRVATKRLVLGE